jgi:trans-aconitate methyltransferase
MAEELNPQSFRDHEKYMFEFDKLPFERILERFRRRKILEILSKIEVHPHKHILEIGPGYNALSTGTFSGSYTTLLEPSKPLFEHNLKMLNDNHRARVLNLDIEGFAEHEPFSKFDLVILSSVLHELVNPFHELQTIYNLMNSKGSLLLVVPNNQSVHRLFGVTMGILSGTESQTETEKLMQQNANFSISTLSTLVKEVGFEISFVTTNFVKPHTHKQMQSWVDNGVLDDGKLEELYKLSEIFHPFNSEIFMIVVKE